MNHNRPLLGILLMIGFCVIAPLGDACAKLIGQVIPLGPTLFLRFLVQVILLAPFVLLGLSPWRMPVWVLRFCVLRTFLHILGIGLMFTALQYIPLADAVAIAFVLPFINLLLGHLWLGETVGPVRITACLIGFIGTLLVVQPSFVSVGWPALLPLLVALNFSVFMLITRHIARDTDPIGLQFVSGAMATALLLPVLLVGQTTGLPILDWPTPTAFEWSLLLGIGVFGTLAHLLMTWSLRYAPSATVTPIQYIEIPVAAVLGWIIFDDLPDSLASFGIAITIGAGLFILFYEQAKLRRQRRAVSQPAPVPPVAE